MDLDQWRITKITKICLLLMGGVSVSACAGLFDFGGEGWKEEVQLSDGRAIVVERETIRVAGGDELAFNRSGTKPKEYRLRFSDPSGVGKIVEWRSTKISPKTWPEVPLVFDFISDKPTVFSLVSISIVCKVYSRYVYIDDVWVEDPLPVQFDRRIANLLIFDDKSMPEFISLKEKRKRNSDSHTQGFRQVGPSRKVCD